MGTALAEALADYRHQLAGTTPAGPVRRRWRVWLVLVLVGLVLVSGAVAMLRPGDSPSAPSTVTVPAPGTADPGPDAGTGAAGGADSPGQGLAALTVAPATGWVDWSTPIIDTWLPRISGAGPADPPGRGFARTPAGALAAAATLHPLAYHAHPRAVWTQIADEQVVWAPGQRESLERALAPTWDSPLATPVRSTPVGYRPVAYNDDRARVRLWWQVSHPQIGQYTVGSLVEVRWSDGDWRLYFDEPAMDTRGLGPTDTYLVWGPS